MEGLGQRQVTPTEEKEAVLADINRIREMDQAEKALFIVARLFASHETLSIVLASAIASLPLRPEASVPELLRFLLFESRWEPSFVLRHNASVFYPLGFRTGMKGAGTFAISVQQLTSHDARLAEVFNYYMLWMASTRLSYDGARTLLSSPPESRVQITTARGERVWDAAGLLYRRLRLGVVVWFCLQLIVASNTTGVADTMQQFLVAVLRQLADPDDDDDPATAACRHEASVAAQIIATAERPVNNSLREWFVGWATKRVQSAADFYLAPDG